MALNLVEASKIALGKDKVINAAIMELYARSSDFLANLPFETISGNAYTFNREKVLPTPDFRALNEGFTESTGEVENITERLCLAGGDIDVDKFLVDTAGSDQRAVQETMKVKAISLFLTKQFFKGDVTSNPKGFDGLQVRLTGVLNLVAAGSTSGGDALSLVKLDEMMDLVEDITHLAMSKAMRRRLSAGARSASVGGYVTYDIDQFGQKVTKYNDVGILIVDRDENNDYIFDFTEAAPGGGTAQCTSIYGLSLTDNGVIGLQNSDMEVRDLGEVPDKPVYRTRIEWYIAMAILRPKAAARLYGITNAAVAA